MAQIPTMFFKFRTWRPENNRTLDLLKKAEFYCQPPRFFDDPNDGLQGARATGFLNDFQRFLDHNIGAEIVDVMQRNNLQSITQLGSVTDPSDIAVIRRAKRKHQRRETRILSFSEDCMSELMWSFYADSHQGICLGFDTTHEFFLNAKQVVYNDLIPSANGSDDVLEDPLLTTKSEAWKWQKEWRLVWNGEEPKNVSFARDSLKIVILGESFKAAGFQLLRKTLDESGYNVALLRMERVPNSFKYQCVQFEPVLIHRGK